ncbi:MAG: hypothetical protein SFU87_07940 [Chitinophagaceae bacterium]|nr:hypothetical protein [Chitinophagaceae bacterium]
MPILLYLVYMSRKYKFLDNERLYFVSFAVINLIDLFIRNEYRDVIVKSLKYCIAHKDLDLYGWCLMTSHMHMVIGSRGNPMQNIMRDFKRHTSEELHAVIKKHPGESRKECLPAGQAGMLQMMNEAGTQNSNNRGFQLWQQNNNPIELATGQMAHQKLDYTHYNPVEAGFVEKPEDWIYSSARNYYGREGLIPIRL